MLSAATRTSGMVTPPDGAGPDRNAAMVLPSPPSATVTGRAFRRTDGRASASTVTATDGGDSDTG